MANKYSFKGFDKENMARALMKDASISTKQGIEIANALRKKEVAKAKAMLESAIAMKTPIKLTRFNKDTGHKKGIGPGRYLKKTASHFLALLENAEANARFKGLDSGKLVISHLCVDKASRPDRFGRQRRRKGKRTHIQVIVEQVEPKEKKKSSSNKEEAKEKETLKK